MPGEGKRLRILHVLPYFYPAWAYGGIPRVVYELSREMVRQGHDVTVFSTDVLDDTLRSPYSGQETLIDGIKTVYFRNISNAMAYSWQAFLPIGLGRYARGAITGFDILHLHGHRHVLNSVIRRQAVQRGVPYVFSGHGTSVNIERRTLLKSFFDQIMGNRVIRDASAFVAVSEHEVYQYASLGIPTEKTTVIHNGIDIDAFSRLPSRNFFRKQYGLMGKKMILYMGKITPRKGIDFLARAFARLSGNDAVLVIAGNDMGFKKQVEAVIKEMSIGDRAIFTGLLTGDDKLAAFQDADVLVYPSIYEIFGLVPFEAIMCGTPVIVTDDCGCGEIIGREDIGYLVEYGNVKALVAAVKRVFSNPAEASGKVERGQRFIGETLGWKRIGRKYIDLYTRVVS